MTREEALNGHWTLVSSYVDECMAVDECDIRFVPADRVGDVYDDGSENLIRRLSPIIELRDVIKFAIEHGLLEQLP